MKLKELKKLVDSAMERQNGENMTVCIPNNKNCWGGTSVTDIRGAYCGFDWDSGKFMIYPKIDMVEKEIEEDEK